MIRAAAALALAALIAGCGARAPDAVAQDLGIVITQPIMAPVPQVAARLRGDVSAASPARLLVIGDSLAQGFGTLLDQRASARDLAIDVTNRGRSSTGLSRSDFYDWPANFEEMAQTLQPDIVVAHFGANDMQTVIADDGRTVYGTEDWEAAYRAQIREILAIAARHDIVLYWIGPGPDGHTNLNAHLARINPLFAQETRTAGANYFPLVPLTTPPDGSFARTVEVDGEAMAMRTADGSHFTGAGYRLVADRIFDALVDRFPELEPATETPATVLAMALQ